MKRNRGAVLTLVLVAMILMGMAMFVLTGGAKAMLFHADTAYLQAVERNLIASGLAWTQQKLAGNSALPAEKPVELDVTAFGVPQARLAVRVLEVRDGTARVHIETSCHKGQRTLHTSRDYTLHQQDQPRERPDRAGRQ
jgi:hypothetical protein